MVHLLQVSAAISSLTLRVLAYVFFRWIPGHPLPPAIYTLALIYYASVFSIGPGEHDKSSVKDAGGSPRLTRSKSKENTVERPVKNNSSALWKSWLLGLPSATRKVNWLALSINALLVACTLDVVYTPPMLYPSDDLSLARLGFVSSTTASILVREPDTSKLPIFLNFRKLTPPGQWRRGSFITTLTNTTDYTQVLSIEQLEPDTKYSYTLSNNHSGTFITLPHTGLAPESSSEADDEPYKFTFLTTSCIKPGFPYSPFSHRLQIPGLQHLASAIPSLKASFMLFLGDFIYIDVPHYLSSSVSNYRSEYRRVYSSPSWNLIPNIPWLHVWDDHEILNDWDQGSSATPFPSARDPFNLYHHSINPPALGKNQTWYTFHAGPASFFLMDTRSYRDPSSNGSATSPQKTMLGPRQLRALLNWLQRPEPQGVRWKIAVSSVPFTRNWRVNAMDTWGGYLAERQKLLEAMWRVPAHSPGTGVIVLSGDRHEFAATRFPAPADNTNDGQAKQQADVFEFSTSPLSMFYLPFRTYREDTPAEISARAEGSGDEAKAENAMYGIDEMVKYIPDGNSKFGAVEMEEELEASVPAKLRFRLFVDGKESWDYEVFSPAAAAAVVEDKTPAAEGPAGEEKHVDHEGKAQERDSMGNTDA